jgi:hypothetical protein
MDYDNNMRGVLFKNDRKESDKHPDYKGSAEVDGVEYWIAAWIKEGKNGKFMSLSFTAKEEEAAPPPAPKGRRSAPPPDDDIPF